MKDKLEYNGTVDENGLLKITNRRAFDTEIKRFSGKPVEIIIQRKRSIRSDNQNRYYWGVVIPCVMQGLNDLGHEMNKEDTHTFIKANFNYTEIVDESTGEIWRTPITSSRLNKTEFGLMIEKAKKFSNDYLNVYIPEPGEQMEIR